MKDTQPPRTSLITSLILAVGITLLVCIAAWAFFSIRYQKQRMMGEILMQTERLSNTIKLGTHYAMMLNSGEDIDRIIRNISRQKEIEFIRIYNKEGLVRFSNRETEIGRRTTIDSEACRICHHQEPPSTELPLNTRVRMLPTDASGRRMMGLITPIMNEPGCTGSCHVHPSDIRVLGLLDVVVSLNETDAEIGVVQNGIIGLADLLAISEVSHQQQAWVNNILQCGENLLALINDVLDMSKIEAGRMTPDEKNFDLFRMLDDLKEMIGFRAEQKGVSLLIEHDPDVPQYIRTDETKLRQVLINIIGNAVKFTSKGKIKIIVK